MPHSINFELTSAATVVVPDMKPQIVAVPGDAIGEFTSCKQLQAPGIYIGIWNQEDGPVVYIGQSGNSVAARAHDAKFRMPTPVSVLIGVTVEGSYLDAAGTRVLERVAHVAFIDAGYRVLGDPPVGVVVEPDYHALLRAFWAKTAISLKLAGLALVDTPVGQILSGPVSAPGVIRTEVPLGPRFAMDTPVGCAEMVQFGTGCCVLPGSTIRFDTTADTKTAGVIAQELICAGFLTPIESGWHRLTKPVALGSASIASRFVLGSIAGDPGRWRGTTEGGPTTPVRHRMPRSKPTESVARGSKYLSFGVAEEVLHV